MTETSDRNDADGPVHGRRGFREHIDPLSFPPDGMPSDEAYELLHTGLMLDGRETLNLASFVTTWMEPEAEALIHDTLRKNHIDHEEYPAASLVEEACVHMLGDLFNAPDPSQTVGVGTIGSSEAIMLGLLAHKRSWRHRREADGLTTDRPNVVYGTETHVVWDKFANYFDVEMRKIPMQSNRFVLSVEDVEQHVDENTIAVGAVLGTTHIGEADPIEDINDLLVGIKQERSWDIPLHVDGASGAFIAPFAEPDLRWDFRLEQVASINASGHKYGLVYPGVGWLIFRDKTKLPEDLVFSVNYLGGAQPTYTFNFSRGSAMIQAQMYNFLRLGRTGYSAIVANMIANARHLNERLEASGKFEILNPGLAEPVVTFRLKGSPGFDVYHLSARLRENGWIVPAYSLPPHAEDIDLMRVVVRLDLSRQMIDILLRDLLTAGTSSPRSSRSAEPPRSRTCGPRRTGPRRTARRVPAWRAERYGRRVLGGATGPVERPCRLTQ
ncbi:MAG: glutamate decarboxylase [Actinomycetota bacterium]